MKQSNFLKFVLLVGDFLVAYFSLCLALVLRNYNLLFNFTYFFNGFLVIFISWVIIIFLLNLYDLIFFKRPLDFIFNLAVFSVLGFLCGIVYFYFFPQPNITPKTILVLNVLIFDVLFFCWRYILSFVLKIRKFKDKIIIVGSKPELAEILPIINKNYELSGMFSEGGDIKSILELKKIVEDKKVNFILLVEADNKFISEIFSNLPLRINYLDFNDLYEDLTQKISVKYLDESWFLEEISKPEDKFEQVIKRLMDMFVSAVGLVVFGLVFPFVAIWIKLDSEGEIFYKQQRVGKNAKIFTLYKFRTMHKDNGQNKTWREKDGNNITKAGKVLRRLHLDELPQAWSILKGDISFVGPRPEWVELAKIFEKEIPFYKQRYLVKPGIIGWAQINYPPSKSVEEAKEKFEYDLYYIKNHSILLDLEIILKAVRLFLW